MDVYTLLEILKDDRKAAIARQKHCIMKLKSCQKDSDDELYWALEYDKAWAESSDLATAIKIIEKTVA